LGGSEIRFLKEAPKSRSEYMIVVRRDSVHDGCRVGI